MNFLGIVYLLILWTLYNISYIFACSPVHEIPKLRSITQPAYKKVQTSSLAIVDEFRYGFPSNGLLKTSNKWWGSSTTINNKDTHVKADRNIEQSEQSEELLKSTPWEGKVGGQSGTDKSNTTPQLSGTGLLSAMRKRALEAGQEALKLGFHQCSGINKPGKREKLLLQGIFGSSLPKEWTDVSSWVFSSLLGRPIFRLLPVYVG